MDTLMWTKERLQPLDRGFWDAFGCMPERYFSAPGRTELGGNHTDHQQGHVLAAAVDLDTRAAVRENTLGVIRVQSRGYPLCTVTVGDWEIREAEKNTTAALVRGVAAEFARLGCPVRGFDVYAESTVLPGSGLSSSAAFEVLLGTVVNGLFLDGQASAVQVARIGQQAENRYFGKPCGLMDQTASAVGGVVAIDFADPDCPVVEQIPFKLPGYRLCIIDCGADHADLTQEYAAIPGELARICGYFGKQVLRQVPRQTFYQEIPRLRQCCADRAVLRAIHFYEEDERACRQAQALKKEDAAAFLALVQQSGASSYMYLQNVIPAGNVDRQEMAIALALCDTLLQGQGAFRVHGGGFAGTVQAFVPEDRLETFRAGIEAVLGQGACHSLGLRSQGGAEILAVE